MLLELLGYLHYPLVISIDNKAVIAILDNLVHDRQTKHIMPCSDHFVRQCVHKGLGLLLYVPSLKSVADIFQVTKPTPIDLYRHQ